MGKGTQALRTGILIGAAFFVVGLFFLFRWIAISAEADNFRENAKEVIAYVSEIERPITGKKRWRSYERRVYVSYAANGQHYEEILKGSTEDMQEHDVFRVQYDPDNPQDVRTTDYTGGSEQYLLASVVCIVSGAAAAVISCVSDRKRNAAAFCGYDAENEQGYYQSAIDKEIIK